ncbi:hypothetical protein [Lysinibacillus capsici]|uniref:hypothetical protein n=1 Tax=Lysinibacillus capsici TaxID=2115968 RepID=UPI0034E5288F
MLEMISINNIYPDTNSYYETAAELNTDIWSIDEIVKELEVKSSFKDYINTTYVYSSTAFEGIKDDNDFELNLLIEGDGDIKESYSHEKTDEELFAELYASADVPDIEEFDSEGFIKYCEELYGMSTKEFRSWFEQEGYEGNVDMQQWYQFTKDIKLDGEVK